MQLSAAFVVAVALVIVTVLIRLIHRRSLQKARDSVVYLSAHRHAHESFEAMICGYETLSNAAEVAINTSIALPDSVGRDEALGQLDEAGSCWDHIEEQIITLIYIDEANRNKIRRIDWPVILTRHERWNEVLRTIEATRVRHDALRHTHISHGQLL